MKDVLSQNLIDSLNVLDLLQEEGLKIVPLVPSPLMIQAGMQVSGLSEDVVKKIYLTMLRFSDEDIPEQKN